MSDVAMLPLVLSQFRIGNGANAIMEEDVVAAMMQHWCGGGCTQHVRRNFQSSESM
jgi:hypothetical protein